MSLLLYKNIYVPMYVMFCIHQVHKQIFLLTNILQIVQTFVAILRRNLLPRRTFARRALLVVKVHFIYQLSDFFNFPREKNIIEASTLKPIKNWTVTTSNQPRRRQIIQFSPTTQHDGKKGKKNNKCLRHPWKNVTAKAISNLTA